MTKKNLRVRQGDVMITRVAALPKGTRKTRADGALAYGEVTGHSHRVADLAEAEVFDVPEKGCYVRVTGEGGVSIVHEEHGAVLLPRGNYRVTIQREYSPHEIRNVVD
jgi:hypothetical protein